MKVLVNTMKEHHPRLPFYTKYEFSASFSKNNETVSDIHTVIQYSKIKPGEICGWVVGSKETYNQLVKIINQPGVYCKLESKNKNMQSISSDEVTFPNITMRQSGYDNINYEVAHLSLMKLTIEEGNPDKKDLSERHLTYFLSGPRSLWLVRMTKMPTLNGVIQTKLHNSTIELNEIFPFSVEVLPYHFYDNDPMTKFDLTTSVMVLHYKTNKDESELSNELFLNLATEITEDLILLISFISRRWIRWYEYTFEKKGYLKTFLRRIGECRTGEPSWNVFKPRQSREFLRTAFTKLRELKSTQFNLTIPLIYYISGNEAKYLEDEFAILFLSLEKLKDLYIAKRQLANILPLDKFQNLEEKIKNEIKQNVPDSQIRSLIYRKISELNRPPLKSVLDSMFLEYGVIWDDLYPPGSEYTFVNTRDRLFHSSDRMDIVILEKEVERLRIIVERLLLKILEWSDLTDTLAQNTKEWLIGAGQ